MADHTEGSAHYCESYCPGDVSSSVRQMKPPRFPISTLSQQLSDHGFFWDPHSEKPWWASQLCRHVGVLAGVLQGPLWFGAVGRDTLFYVTFRSPKHIQNPCYLWSLPFGVGSFISNSSVWTLCFVCVCACMYHALEVTAKIMLIQNLYLTKIWYIILVLLFSFLL